MIKLCNDTSTAILFHGEIYISLDGTIVGSDFITKRLFLYIKFYGKVCKLSRLNVPESILFRVHFSTFQTAISNYSPQLLCKMVFKQATKLYWLNSDSSNQKCTGFNMRDVVPWCIFIIKR